MGLVGILVESLRLLRKEPKLYIPRIITTAIYTAFVLYAAKLSLEISRAITMAQAQAEATGAQPDFGGAFSEFSGSLYFLLAFFLLSYAIDILSYGMYVRIVQDYRSKIPIQLIAALREALGKGKALFALSVVILIFLAAVLLLYAILGSMFLVTRSILFPALAILVLLLGLVAFALVFFFAIPIAMVENKGALSAIAASAKLGFKHRGVVLRTNFFFAGLILVTLLVAMLTDFSGRAGAAAVIAFVLGRLFQALVYTYISVVNPAVYLYLEETR